MRKLAAEAYGTFALVFAGTGAIVINDVSGGSVGHVGVSITFGLIVTTMIYSIGDVSGCHLNPAVTIGLFAAKQFPARLLVPYICSQMIGAFVASLTLRLMFPEHQGLGATTPFHGALRSFVLEIILTLILMYVILSFTNAEKEKMPLAGIVIGGVIMMEAMFAGPISGASMNPARSLAPAVVAMRLDSLWVYLTAPVLGAFAGVHLWRFTQHDRSANEPNFRR